METGKSTSIQVKKGKAGVLYEVNYVEFVQNLD